MGIASDITYLRTGEGFMYHCVIRDIETGDVLGDHMADRMTKELVINAILAMLRDMSCKRDAFSIVIEEVSTHQKQLWLC